MMSVPAIERKKPREKPASNPSWLIKTVATNLSSDCKLLLSQLFYSNLVANNNPPARPPTIPVISPDFPGLS